MKCSASLTLAPSPFLLSLHLTWLEDSAWLCGSPASPVNGHVFNKGSEQLSWNGRFLWKNIVNTFQYFDTDGDGNVRAAMFCFIAILGKKTYEKLVQEFLF